MTESPPTHARGALAAEVSAQAKINLRLRILAREASGYHQIETLFLRVALADTVRVRRTLSSRTLDLDIQSLPPGTTLGPVEENLAWRAAVAYLNVTGDRGGFAIELMKRIPVGAGLGGGSADAGAVLRALDAIARHPLGERRLLGIAATLGADVPFLTCEHPYALGWGRGERLLSLRTPPTRQLVLVIPHVSVNTAAAYGWLGTTDAGELPIAHETELLDATALCDWGRIVGIATNDFEPVVAVRYPIISTIVAELRGFGSALAMMTGSGSAVFGVMPPGADPHGFKASRGLDARTLVTSTATRVEPVVPLD